MARRNHVDMRGIRRGIAVAVVGIAAAAGVAAPAQAVPFRHAPSAALTIIDITPMGASKEKVGVGFPIIVTFNRSVVNKAAVEALLEVTSEKPVEGAWRWVSSTKVVYRTKTYWPAHQKVKFIAHLDK